MESNGLKPDFILDESNISNILNHYLIPRKLYDKSGKLILYVYKHTKKYGEMLSYNYNETKKITYSIDVEENANIAKSLDNMGLIRISHATNNGANISITDDGMKYAEELLKGYNSSPKCFIARWFIPEIDEIYNSFIMPEITRLGFDPIVISSFLKNSIIL